MLTNDIYQVHTIQASFQMWRNCILFCVSPQAGVIDSDVDVVSVSHSRLLGLTTRNMSEGESKQAPDTVQDGKSESMAAATGQGVSSVSPPVSMVTQPPATAATEDEEEESEDESEILEESPCGRWQKRREEVGDVSAEERSSPLTKVNNAWCIVLVSACR